MEKVLQIKRKHHHVWANHLRRWSPDGLNVFYSTKTGGVAFDGIRGLAMAIDFYKLTTLNDQHIQVLKMFSRTSSDFLHQLHMNSLNDFLQIQDAENVLLAQGGNIDEIELLIRTMQSNALENLHSFIEDEAKPIADELATGNLDVLLNDDNMLTFMVFFGHQITRTKHFKDIAANTLVNDSRDAKLLSDTLVHAWWFVSYMIGMNLGHSFYSTRHQERHSLVINDTDTPFITSEQPIINIHPCVSETEVRAPTHSDFYYPLSPKYAYVISQSEKFDTGKFSITDSDTVRELNTKMAKHANQHIYGNSKEVLLPLLKNIGHQQKRTQPK